MILKIHSQNSEFNHLRQDHFNRVDPVFTPIFHLLCSPRLHLLLYNIFKSPHATFKQGERE